MAIAMISCLCGAALPTLSTVLPPPLLPAPSRPALLPPSLCLHRHPSPAPSRPSLALFPPSLCLHWHPRYCLPLAFAKRTRGGDQQPSSPPISSFARISLQALLFVLTLGFLDAGYSGDWSRIGVLSPEFESMLRLAAYGVVPLALFLIWFISNKDA